MLLLFGLQGALQPGIDLGGTIRAAFSALGGRTEAEIVFWTEAELFEFADEACKALAKSGMFIYRVEGITVATGFPTLTVPRGFMSVLAADFSPTALGPVSLLPANEDEIEAGDAAWHTRTGDPDATHFIPSLSATVRLWPIPQQDGALGVVVHNFPPAVARDTPFCLMPQAAEPYVDLAVIRGARAMEGEGAMPEVAKAAGQFMDLMAMAATQYYGGAQ